MASRGPESGWDHVWEDEASPDQDASNDLTEFAFTAPTPKVPAAAQVSGAPAPTVAVPMAQTDDLEAPAPGAPVPTTHPRKALDEGTLGVGDELTGTSSSLLTAPEPLPAANSSQDKGAPTMMFDGQAAAIRYAVSKSMGEDVGPPDVGNVLVGTPAVALEPTPASRSAPLPSPVEGLELEPAAEEAPPPEEEAPLELAFDPREQRPSSLPPRRQPARLKPVVKKKSYGPTVALFVAGLVVILIIVAGYLRQAG